VTIAFQYIVVAFHYSSDKNSSHSAQLKIVHIDVIYDSL